MSEPREPREPRTTADDDEPGVVREGSLTPGGNRIGPKAWRLIVALNQYDDWLGAVLEVVDEAAILDGAVEAAGGGLDAAAREFIELHDADEHSDATWPCDGWCLHARNLRAALAARLAATPAEPPA